MPGGYPGYDMDEMVGAIEGDETAKEDMMKKHMKTRGGKKKMRRSKKKSPRLLAIMERAKKGY